MSNTGVREIPCWASSVTLAEQVDGLERLRRQKNIAITLWAEKLKRPVQFFVRQLVLQVFVLIGVHGCGHGYFLPVTWMPVLVETSLSAKSINIMHRISGTTSGASLLRNY